MDKKESKNWFRQVFGKGSGCGCGTLIVPQSEMEKDEKKVVKEKANQSSKESCCG